MHTFRIVTPFALGYFPLAILLRAYRRASVPLFALKSACAWLVGMTIGFAIRTLVMGSRPSVLFVKIALLFTGLSFALVRSLIWGIDRIRSNGRPGAKPEQQS